MRNPQTARGQFFPFSMFGMPLYIGLLGDILQDLTP